MILGVGLDLVSLSGMAEQLATPGSKFLDRVLTRREHRVVHHRSPGSGSSCVCAQDPAAVERIGALWAVKEAVVKAWSAAIFGKPPPLGEEELVWTEIEVVHDHWERPAIELHGHVGEAFRRTLLVPGRHAWHVSTSRDHDFAMATVILSGT
ncbi:holo-ACP synthase [Aeromicrobium sp.]|uniref:holo-ACP synthase n=1 Tax=Aeromicrobium sp. TaxID=1871063 RepID=UPI0025C3A4DC|nr:holo-ACP synthase [Aeromicrobium sp.]